MNIEKSNLPNWMKTTIHLRFKRCLSMTRNGYIIWLGCQWGIGIERGLLK